jgi:hypothetical protein
MKSYSHAAMAALVSLSTLLSGPRPGGAETCATVDSVAEQIRDGTPDAEVAVVTGAPAARLDSGISRLTGSAVPVGGSYLVRFAHGCATHHGRFPDRLVRIWIEGSPA